MLRIDDIQVRKDTKSEITFPEVRQLLAEKLEKIVSATSYKVRIGETELNIILYKPISLPTVNQLLNDLEKNKIKVDNLFWKCEKKGPFRRGHLEIIIS